MFSSASYGGETRELIIKGSFEIHMNKGGGGVNFVVGATLTSAILSSELDMADTGGNKEDTRVPLHSQIIPLE